MTLTNTIIIQEMNEIFQRIHARIDQRYQQLTRQINSQSNSMIHSHKNSKINLTNRIIFQVLFFISDITTIVFSPVNQSQLEETIKNFGRIITSTSIIDIERCESVFMLFAFNHTPLLSLLSYAK